MNEDQKATLALHLLHDRCDTCYTLIVKGKRIKMITGVPHPIEGSGVI